MNVLKRIWRWFWQPSAQFAVGMLLIVGFVVGAGGVIVFNVVLANTNTLAFCTGCHEMEPPLKEYQATIHYQNRTGVRAECPDCHVPKSGVPKLMAKVTAANDVLHAFLGTIATPEKYEEHRPAMAKAVWARMKANDSRECRSCHAFEAMKFDLQDKTGSKKHQKVMKDDGDDRKTCIDCHKGIAHKVPPGLAND